MIETSDFHIKMRLWFWKAFDTLVHAMAVTGYYLGHAMQEVGRCYSVHVEPFQLHVPSRPADPQIIYLEDVRRPRG